jgi:hypothetical protein
MLSRLLKMGVGEVADRSFQEASKWLDRKSAQSPQSPGSVAAPASLALPDDFDVRTSAHFFGGAVDAQTGALLLRLTPGLMAETVAAADRVVARRFNLLGYRDLSFGHPLDWHLDPVSGGRFPHIHWTLIDPADPLMTGDCKVVWELSRHQFLVTLGLAFRATRQETYAGDFERLARSWLLANPVGFGINWVSSLEAAMRIVSWSWSLHLFAASSRLPLSLAREIVAGIVAHASHIERYLSRHSSPNTHLTGEALGLFYAGVLFPLNPRAARLRSLGQEILEEQIHIQVLCDGTYFEQSTAYQRYTVEIYLHYLILAERNHIAVSAAVRERVQAMLDLLLAVRRPDGSMPSIGDADGGSLLPLVPRSPDDARGLFAIAAAVFGRSDYAWAAGGLQPEVLWFFGAEGLKHFEPLAPQPPTIASRSFDSGGFAVMRSGWTRDAHHLVLDAGPLGCPITGAHGHADLLSVQVSPFGEPCIVDPGTYAYSADPNLRTHFRGTSAHSTVLVDGLGQAEPRGAFAWKQRPAAMLRAFRTEPSFDFADSSHEAYARLRDPVGHRRRVVFVKSPGYWLIADDLSGKQEHRVELRFQFAPLAARGESRPAFDERCIPSGLRCSSAEYSRYSRLLGALPDGRIARLGAAADFHHGLPTLDFVDDSWARAPLSQGRGLLVRSFSNVPLEARISCGSTSPLEGWVSSDYGQREPAPLLVYRATTRLPVRIITLLLPVIDRNAAPPGVRPMRGESDAFIGISLEGVPQIFRFDSETLSMCEA